jgi:hypothetical protein
MSGFGFKPKAVKAKWFEVKTLTIIKVPEHWNASTLK